MMWIYQALDIITTFSQSLIIFVMGETLCRKPRAKFSRWMPPVIITATTFYGPGLLWMRRINSLRPAFADYLIYAVLQSIYP